jgi:hypothetical protein
MKERRQYLEKDEAKRAFLFCLISSKAAHMK